MSQADLRSSTADAPPSAGNVDKNSPQLRTTMRAVGRMQSFRDGHYRSQALAAITGSDSDRLVEIGNRSQDILKLLDVLGCEESLDDHATALVTILMREVDTLATIAIQPMVAVEWIQ